MAETSSENSESPTMSAVFEASKHVRALAEPWRAGDSAKAGIRRAARNAGIAHGLAKRLWYGEARRIDSELMDKLRVAARDRQSLEAAQDAHRSIIERIAACEAALGLRNADPVGLEPDAMGRAGRDPDSALD